MALATPVINEILNILLKWLAPVYKAQTVTKHYVNIIKVVFVA